MSNNKYRGWKIVLLLLVVFLLPAHASETAEKEAFNPGKFIIGHISDAYGWHITAFGKNEISIPLPVIVKSQDRGWFVFSSSRFEHGHAAYEGFELSTSDKYNGKVVEIQPNNGEIRPMDLSITKNVASLLISAILLLVIFMSLAKHYRKAPMVSPRGFQGAMEVVVVFIQNEVIKPCIGKDYLRYSPYLLTVFFFILINNLLGVIPFFPGGANLTGNIAVTFVLATCTFVAVNVFGSKHYWKDILWPEVPVWLKCPIPMMPFLELVGIFSKPVALMIRLFANMLAGHMIAMVFMALIFVFGSISPMLGSGVSVLAILFAIFMNFLELLVIFIQAYVFTLLSSVFIGLSRMEPQKEH
ncbi:MAG: F0F1 ATP synthase subunit A [Bacteroidales bacterium]|nr:F0F1 ATP synthase subunit A [Bacteroidales bacterium]